jgi:hypothetical protein
LQSTRRAGCATKTVRKTVDETVVKVQKTVKNTVKKTVNKTVNKNRPPEFEGARSSLSMTSAPRSRGAREANSSGA